LRDIRAKANRVYVKLEDWIHVANKAENDAVDEMVRQIVHKISIIYSALLSKLRLKRKLRYKRSCALSSWTSVLMRK